MSFPRLLAFAPFVFVVAAACGSDPEAAPVGVNDVRKACEIRTTWQRLDSLDCSECFGIASAQKCDCPNLQRDYAGKCASHRDAKLAEPACEGVDACVNACPKTDCGCVEGCYAGKDACRPIGNAMDGCLAEVCDAYCR